MRDCRSSVPLEASKTRVLGIPSGQNARLSSIVAFGNVKIRVSSHFVPLNEGIGDLQKAHPASTVCTFWGSMSVLYVF